MQAGRRGLYSRNACGLFPGRRVERTGNRDRHRENRAISVHDIHGKKERDAVFAFLDGDPLKRAERFGARDMEIGSHLAGAHPVELGIGEP